LERLVGERTAEVEAANRRLLQLSREDALTGVANRRRLDETLAEEWARAARHDRPLSLILVDVDRFKAFNDLLGHPAGDQCLRRVGELLAGLHARAGETVARYGGEEFAILLPDYEQGEAMRAAERIRAMVAGLRIRHPESGRTVTVSAGVATARPARGGQPSDLVAEADRALYRAKAEGRDRVAAA
ncbi:MAG: GGDEF domain-containing protein, partial [Geminicoccaceae bacterium]|nr:GGDEF domain-containing protein [Geminicoccaceae bacterium]